ncbi:MAG: hypothetical protein P4L61_03725 [Candidatus Pacebacteria bacterium]|nr:hypothetical protein [Candidatus Paceibacterota bacterium]
MSIHIGAIILGILLLALAASPYIITSLRTGRRLKRGELKHHVDSIRDPKGSCDRTTAQMHFDEARSIVDDRLRWSLSLSDVGYELGLAELDMEKENTIRRYEKSEAAFMSSITRETS